MAKYVDKNGPVTFCVEECHTGTEQLHDSYEQRVQPIFITNGFE